MQGWQTPYLGLRDLPRELTEFELQAFFSFSQAELELISRRRGDNHKLGPSTAHRFRAHEWPPFEQCACGPARVAASPGPDAGLHHTGLGVAACAVRPWPDHVRPPAAGLRGAGLCLDDASFRRELRRVLNRGEAVNALKRAIYTGRVGPAQSRRADEMQAVADALSLLANIVMAWNTTQMQAVLDRWANRRQIVPPELTGRIAPTRLEGINLRGIFRFPLERCAGQILPSQTTAKTSAGG